VACALEDGNHSFSTRLRSCGIQYPSSHIEEVMQRTDSITPVEALASAPAMTELNQIEGE
jgi:hypothetical protein